MIAIAIAGVLALFGSLLGTRIAVDAFARRGYGQPIRLDGPRSHEVKRGTPTMGGLVIIMAVDLGYLIAKLLTLSWPSASTLLVLFLFNGLGIVGYLDDYRKTSLQHSRGLPGWAKIAGQAVVGVLFAVVALQFPDARDITPASRAVSFLRDIPVFQLPLLLVFLWVLLLIAGASNGVNLTDGLDGLAAGSCAMI